MTSKWRAFAMVLTVLGTGSDTAICGSDQPQAVKIDLSGPYSCEQCTIALDTVVALDDTAGPGMIDLTGFRITADPRGRFYLYQTGLAGVVVVIGADGNVIRTIGREGRGPGEYRAIYPVATGNDSLHIFDVANRRHTVLSPDYRVAKRFPLRQM